MTTSLFVIANVKQLRTDGSFRIALPFFRTSWGVGVLNSANFNSFHNRVDFGTILEGLRNFGVGMNPPNSPPWYATDSQGRLNWLWAYQPSIHLLRLFFQGQSGPRRVVNLLPPSSAEVKNKWIYNSTPLYAVMSWARRNLSLPLIVKTVTC